jgi:hypothetical protein
MANGYCYIGISRLPFHRLLFQQNRAPGWKVGSKATKSIAPHWCVELVMGPFPCGKGVEFKKTWRRSSRRFIRRVRQGVQMAVNANIPIYCRDVQFVKTILAV